MEIITNGDVLTSKRLQDLYLSKASKVLVSMYDGPEQIEKFETIANSEFNLKADLVLLAMGFVSPVIDNLTLDLDIKRDNKNNIQANDKNYKTSHKKIWVAGDMRRGQSLVVWAIREGRQCAHEVDKELMGRSALPR